MFIFLIFLLQHVFTFLDRNDKEVGAIESAHDGIIWDLAWHPLGHILCSGSNDHTSKFWTRNRPGDKMRDKYNLNTLPAGVLADDSMDIGEAKGRKGGRKVRERGKLWEKNEEGYGNTDLKDT